MQISPGPTAPVLLLGHHQVLVKSYYTGGNWESLLPPKSQIEEVSCDSYNYLPDD